MKSDIENDEKVKQLIQAAYDKGYKAGFESANTIQDIVTEYLEAQMMQEIFVVHEPLLKDTK